MRVPQMAAFPKRYGPSVHHLERQHRMQYWRDPRKWILTDVNQEGATKWLPFPGTVGHPCTTLNANTG